MAMEPVKYQAENGDNLTLTIDTVRGLLTDNPTITDREAMLFMALCKSQKLNPFIGDASLVKYGNKPATMVVGKETFTKRALRNEKCKGFQAGITLLDSEGNLVRREGSMVLPGEKLMGGWAKCFMDGYEVPFYEEVGFNEYAGRKRDGTLNRTWSNRPGTMIRKVALVHALREAMPENFQGLYDEAEMAKDAEGNAQLVEAPQGGTINPEQQAWEVMPESQRNTMEQHNEEPDKAELYEEDIEF